MRQKIKILLESPTYGQKALMASPGETLRTVLLRNNVTPYRGKFQITNCRGLGICGSCKVRLRENDQWWERRSCQIRIYRELQVAMD